MDNEEYIDSLYEDTPEPEDYDDASEFEDKTGMPSCWL